MPYRKHVILQLTVLLAAMGAGAINAPIIGVVRQSIEDRAGISPATLGFWVFVIGLVGGVAGLAMAVTLRGMHRTTIFRIGIVMPVAGCLLLAFSDAGPGWALLPIAIAWAIISFGLPLQNTANGMYVDLWPATPHTGVIILHTINAVGKLMAPLLVLVLGDRIGINGIVYAALFGALMLISWCWPRRSVQHLKDVEAMHGPPGAVRLPRELLVWLCGAQFMFIAGSEAGATVVLKSYMQWRGSPIDGMADDTWGEWMVGTMLFGIVLGRVIFSVLSIRHLSARQTITACMVCGLGSLLAVFVADPWVYVAGLLLTGVCFSATWPAFFALAARAYPGHKTFLSLASALFSVIGITACMGLASWIGNRQATLPHAFMSSVAVMAIFAIFLYVTNWGRRLDG